MVFVTFVLLNLVFVFALLIVYVFVLFLLFIVFMCLYVFVVALNRVCVRMFVLLFLILCFYVGAESHFFWSLLKMSNQTQSLSAVPVC